MPTYIITDSQTGKKYRVTGDGSREDALREFEAQFQEQIPEAPDRETLPSVTKPKAPEVTASGLAKAGGAGLRSGLEGLAAIPGDTEKMGGVNPLDPLGSIIRLGSNALRGLGVIDKDTKVPLESGFFPTSEQIGEATTSVVGENYKPQNVAEEYAYTLGEFAPAAATGPGGVVRKGITAAVPAIVSESAGQAARNVAPEYEGIARTVGALGGSVLTPTAKVAAIDKATKNVRPKRSKWPVSDLVKGEFSDKAADQIKNRTNKLYTAIERADIRYDANAFDDLFKSIDDLAYSKGLNPTEAPKTFAAIEMLRKKQGQSPRWLDIEGARKALGRAMTEIDPNTRRPTTDAYAASRMFNIVNRFHEGAPSFSAVGSMSPREIAGIRKMMQKTGAAPKSAPGQTYPSDVLTGDELLNLQKEARKQASRRIKSEIIENRAKIGGKYVSGIESGLRNQMAGLLKKDFAGKQFPGIEQDLLERVAGGSIPRNALAHMGRFGVDLSPGGGIASFAPALAAGGYGYATGDWKNAAIVAGLASIAKRGARDMAINDVARAMGVVRLTPEQQKKLVQMIKTDQGRKFIAAAMMANEAQNNPAEVTVTGDMARGN